MCGIKRKLLYPELYELISEYDLFCVTETKIDSYDIIALPGYKFLSQTRKQKWRHGYICERFYLSIYFLS